MNVSEDHMRKVRHRKTNPLCFLSQKAPGTAGTGTENHKCTWNMRVESTVWGMGSDNGKGRVSMQVSLGNASLCTIIHTNKCLLTLKPSYTQVINNEK